MMSIESLLPFVFASAFLSIAPGPDNVFVLMQSAMYGKKSGVFVTLGLCTGLMVHTTAVAFGVAAIFQSSLVAFTVLKILGALYLAYLAVQAFRASASEFDMPSSNFRTIGALYRRGIIMNITNPKVTIFFLAFLPQFASPDQGALSPQIFFLGGVFISVSLIIFSAIAIAAGSLGGWIQSSPKTQVYLNRIAGTVFAALALKLATATNNA
ncbi:Homoserine/homoserine lactone efflux protein [BD1-7 clade bacterium]|uniref:Homoserine/homoserine lactone efflux protein n=1 Tax=BD1-7 clade bacterium TaxID=2029982 RepID=A0A5S9Q8C6_9GAMM|nr:Homoserine/homoserine lactone efflux protein [BD1-7 clade bacterium]